MTITTVPATFDTAALQAAIHNRDAAAQLALYAPDAELHLVDQRTPPSSPRILRGHAEIGPHLEQVCARDMSHHVTRAFATGDDLAYEVECFYPDGTRVLCQAIGHLEDGRITAQRGVQAWDA
jgi:ketosteroid isomerase-like protein